MINCIGRTPIVKLQKIVDDENCADVWVKLEYYNPTASYKDRAAKSMIEKAEERGQLSKGMTVVEWTGGSTGIAIAFVCAAKGYPCRIVSNDAVAKEKLQSIVAFGGQLELLKSVDGKLTPDLVPRLGEFTYPFLCIELLFFRMMNRAQEIAKERPSYYTNQMTNPDMVAGYESMAGEIVEHFQRTNLKVDAFCGCSGTSGMIVGCGRSLRATYDDIRIIAFEPSTSAVLSGGTPGAHNVDGTAPGFLPPQFNRSVVREARAIDEIEGRKMARRLASEEGIFAGTSTGLNVQGAIQLAKELGRGHVVVTVACDSGLKYLAGNLFQSPL